MHKQVKRMCLVLVLRDGTVLAGVKQRGLGAGRVVAPGGHVEPGESGAEAGARELHEETGLVVAPDRLADAGRLWFSFPGPDLPDLEVGLYAVRGPDGPTGEPADSDEIHARWLPVDALPLASMWDDDRFWLPGVLGGNRVEGRFRYAADRVHVASAEVRFEGRWAPGIPMSPPGR